MTTYTVWVTRVWGRGTWDEEYKETQVVIKAACVEEAEKMGIAIVEEIYGSAPIIEAETSEQEG